MTLGSECLMKLVWVQVASDSVVRKYRITVPYFLFLMEVHAYFSKVN